MPGRIVRSWSLGILIVLAAAGCARIPREAPELSAELGNRIAALESSHVAMLRTWMDDRRRALDDFIEREWLPEFSRNLMDDPAMRGAWETVAREHATNPEQTLRFFVTVGPRLQQRINAKRSELMQPLEELERLTDEEIQQLFPTPADVQKLAALMKIVKSADAHNQKINQLASNIQDLAGTVLVLLAKFA